MFFNLFTEYLLENKLLDVQQTRELRLSQNKTRVKLGLIAVAEKMLTEKQAEEINRKQTILDKRFGDIAVELGYLNSSQISRLLDLQGNAYIVFCQNITDKGYMTLSQVNDEIEKYAALIGFDDLAYEAFKADDIDGYISYFIPGNNSICSDLLSVAIRTTNRIISSDISVSKGTILSRYESCGVAYQVLEGDYDIITGIAGDKEGMLEVAGIFADEKYDDLCDDALDAIGEYINIINGLYATNLSYRKIKVELLPPRLSNETVEISNKEIFVIPVCVNSKKFDLFVGIG